VAHSGWLKRVPRGPLRGCHVAPHDSSLVYCLKFGLVVGEVRTPDLRAGQRFLTARASHSGYGQLLVMQTARNII
jgi:hypothetical protein